jgi:hypothetical protein
MNDDDDDDNDGDDQGQERRGTRRAPIIIIARVHSTHTRLIRSSLQVSADSGGRREKTRMNAF